MKMKNNSGAEQHRNTQINQRFLQDEHPCCQNFIYQRGLIIKIRASNNIPGRDQHEDFCQIFSYKIYKEIGVEQNRNTQSLAS